MPTLRDYSASVRFIRPIQPQNIGRCQANTVIVFTIDIGGFRTITNIILLNTLTSPK